MPDPSPLSLTQTRIVGGIWEGVLAGAGATPPALEARHLDRVLDGLTLSALPGTPAQFAVRLPIPAAVLAEGVQTVLVLAGGDVLARITLVVGVPLEDDLRAEISLLRAELDLLKRAFRRHCAETAG
jgi:hypothetical protein